MTSAAHARPQGLVIGRQDPMSAGRYTSVREVNRTDACRMEAESASCAPGGIGVPV